jgi:GNAT superfamily N-acetyltransferase
MGLIIRKGEKEDISSMMRLVKELAEFEKAADQVSNTEEQMLIDGFGDHPIFGSFVAELDGEIVGTSIYYFRYSTWKGKRLYLEDIVVNEECRGKGVGKALFEATVAKAKEENCTGMMWQVLDWNQSAISFYKQYGTRFDSDWVNCKLDF